MKREEALSASEGFGAILPPFTEMPEAGSGNGQPFNFGLGDLRDIKAFEEILARAGSGEAGLEALAALPGTRGFRPLNDGLAAMDSAELGRETRAEDVLLCCGACDGLVLSLLATTAPGEGIVFPVPSFPYWWVFSGTGRETFPLYFEDAETYRTTFGDRVRQAIRENPSIRAVVLNEPQNPMGASLEDGQLAILQALAEEGRIAVIVDDVARSFADSGSGWWRVLDPDRVVVVNSFTKRYAAPGLRLGWLRARGDWLTRAHNLAANWRVGVATPVAKWGLGIIEALGQGEVVAREVQRRRDALVRTVTGNGRRFPSICTEGRGVYALIDSRCEEIEESGLALKAAAAEAGVVLMGAQFLFPPGFDAEASRWMLRLSIAGESRIEEGLNRLYESGARLLAGSGGSL